MLAIIGGSDGGSILAKPISISVAKALKIPSITVLKGVTIVVLYDYESITTVSVFGKVKVV